VTFPTFSPVSDDRRRPCLAAMATVGLGIFLETAAPMRAQEGIGLNRVVERLSSEQPAIGTFTRSPDPDLHFAVIDAQYGDFDLEGVRRTMAGMRVGDNPPAVAPIVRIPYAARDAPQEVVNQLLNTGVMGVMFPDIETPDQARSAVASMRFENAIPPEPSGRREPSSGNAPSYWDLNEDSYRRGADVWPLNPSGQLVAILQIESQRGIDRLDEILGVPGVGAIFLGPTDLANAIGAEGPNAPQVEVLVQQVLSACLAAGIPCGYPIVATSPEAAARETARRLAEGFTVLAIMTVSR